MTSRISASQARDILRSTLPKPKANYGNIKHQVEGITFDSKGELNHWMHLNLRQAAGEISNLKRQVRFVLCPPVRLVGEDRASAITYVADFQYEEDGKTVVADYKGFDTPMGRLKRRLMAHVHGIDVLVVTKRSRGAESEEAA
ncbi:MAG: DUF1064 domain-containing protein [Asticcacaulis sp.]|uniref:DUF1064 domain-containing protein n=1 Tax=Asticcacaulis sp. TaxID=1872648 RepID=UPI0039E493DB